MTRKRRTQKEKDKAKRKIKRRHGTSVSHDVDDDDSFDECLTTAIVVGTIIGSDPEPSHSSSYDDGGCSGGFDSGGDW